MLLSLIIIYNGKKQLHDTIGAARRARWFTARRCNPLRIIFKQNLIRSEGGTTAASAAEPLSTNFHTNRLDLDQ